MKPLYQIQVFCTAGCVNRIQDALLLLRRDIQDDDTTGEMMHGITTTRCLTVAEMEAFDRKKEEVK